MDPHSFKKLDPDPHSPKNLDPDPHKVNADPKHCHKHQILCIHPSGIFGTHTMRPNKRRLPLDT
jgi:hypothetical protein